MLKKRVKKSLEKFGKNSQNKAPEKSPGETVSSAPSREKLLKAAFEVFSKSGYHGTTTKMISTAAGVNEALITRHFGTKQGLFLEVIKRHVTEDPPQLDYPPQADLASELICFSNYVFERDRKNVDFLRIFIGHGLVDPSFAKSMRERMDPPTSKLLHSRLLLLQTNKKLSLKVDLSAIESALMGLTLSAILFSLLLPMIDEKLALSNLRSALKYFAVGVESYS